MPANSSERDTLVAYALEKFRHAVRLRPDFDRGCYNMGTVLYSYACAVQAELAAQLKGRSVSCLCGCVEPRAVRLCQRPRGSPGHAHQICRRRPGMRGVGNIMTGTGTAAQPEASGLFSSARLRSRSPDQPGCRDVAGAPRARDARAGPVHGRGAVHMLGGGAAAVS